MDVSVYVNKSVYESGLLYVRGSYTSSYCRHMLTTSRRTSRQRVQEFNFNLPYGHCQHNYHKGNKTRVMRVVLTDNPYIITSTSKAYMLQCTYPVTDGETESNPVAAGPGQTGAANSDGDVMSGVDLIAATSAPITIDMSILSLTNRPVTSAQLGQTLKLHLSATGGYNVYVSDCKATAGFADIQLPPLALTDNYGCTIDEQIMTNFRSSKHKSGVEALFQAFTFPTAETVKFKCDTKVCLNRCPTAPCSGNSAYSRNKRGLHPESSVGIVRATRLQDADKELPLTAEQLITGSTELVVQGYLRLKGEHLHETYNGKPALLALGNSSLDETRDGKIISNNGVTVVADVLESAGRVCVSMTLMSAVVSIVCLVVVLLLILDAAICCLTAQQGSDQSGDTFYYQHGDSSEPAAGGGRRDSGWFSWLSLLILHQGTPSDGNNSLRQSSGLGCPWRRRGGVQQQERQTEIFRKKYIRNKASVYARRVPDIHSCRDDSTRDVGGQEDNCSSSGDSCVFASCAGDITNGDRYRRHEQ